MGEDSTVSGNDKRLQRGAEAALVDAFDAYMLWQPDGDWDTFMSFADDEGGPKGARIHKRFCAPPGEDDEQDDSQVRRAHR